MPARFTRLCLLAALGMTLAVPSSFACMNAMKEKNKSLRSGNAPRQQYQMPKPEKQRHNQIVQLVGLLAVPLGIAGLVVARRRRLEDELEL